MYSPIKQIYYSILLLFRPLILIFFGDLDDGNDFIPPHLEIDLRQCNVVVIHVIIYNIFIIIIQVRLGKRMNVNESFLCFFLLLSSFIIANDIY